MNAAVALASGKLPGVTVVLDSIVSAGDADQLIGVVNEKILSGTMSENTKQVLRRELAGIADPGQLTSEHLLRVLGHRPTQDLLVDRADQLVGVPCRNDGVEHDGHARQLP